MDTLPNNAHVYALLGQLRAATRTRLAVTRPALTLPVISIHTWRNNNHDFLANGLAHFFFFHIWLSNSVELTRQSCKVFAGGSGGPAVLNVCLQNHYQD